MTWWQITLATIFWGAFLLIIFNYFGLLLLVKSLNLLRGSLSSKLSTGAELPFVSIIMPVHNEAEVLPAKLDNLLQIDYPPEKCEIIIASDQSADRTVEIARSRSDARIRVYEMERRSGKPGIIDALAPQAQGEIVVVTDANVFLAAEALRKMIELYSNPQVGCVCGNLHLTSPTPDRTMIREMDYRQSEINLKIQLDKWGRVIGVFGGFYSFRRRLYRPLGDKPCHDDIIIPLEILAQGYQVRFAAEALAVEQTRDTIGGEYQRRVRMSAFNILTLTRMLNLSVKSGFLTTFLVISYKVLRWLGSFIIAAMIISAFIAASSLRFYLYISIAFGLIIMGAIIGGIIERAGVRWNPMRSLYHFMIMNLAALVGFGRAIRGMPRYWTPQSRDKE